MVRRSPSFKAVIGRLPSTADGSGASIFAATGSGAPAAVMAAYHRILPTSDRLTEKDSDTSSAGFLAVRSDAGRIVNTAVGPRCQLDSAALTIVRVLFSYRHDRKAPVPNSL